MSILKKLQSIATHRGLLSKALLRNWKPKLICLLLAVAVWWMVEHWYVRESPEWNLDDFRLSVPEFNN